MSRDIKLLHPTLQSIIPQFIEECKRNNLIVKTTETWRTKEEQDDLYAKGRTKQGKKVTNAKYPQSNHCWGVAFDFCRNDGHSGGAFYDGDGFFSQVGKIGKKFGLIWGGDWKSIVDKPHFELADYNWKTLQKIYGTPETFKKSWIEVKKEIEYIVMDRLFKYNDTTINIETIIKDNEQFVKVKDISKLLNKHTSFEPKSKLTEFSDNLIEIKIKNISLKDKDNINILNGVNINGNNYVKIRDYNNIINYETDYDPNTKTVLVKNNHCSRFDKIKSLFDKGN